MSSSSPTKAPTDAPAERDRAYQDPLDRIWLATAAKVGLKVVRTDDAYAATDGRGVLRIATAAGFDRDDSLAQYIFHELCHWLIAGHDAVEKPDWGMDNIGDGDVWMEHACLRLQRVLARRYGLAGLLAPTTEYRAFWNTLPADPLADRSDRSVQAAIVGLHLADRAPFSPALPDALAATAAIAQQVAAFAGNSQTLWTTIAPRRLHVTGVPAGFDTGETCGTCAWRSDGPRGACKQTLRRTAAEWPACERWEPPLDCLQCGACCREAYHAVEVGPREAFVKTHPELVVQMESGRQILRTGDRCAALSGGELVKNDDGWTRAPYQCTVYADRPRTCRDFTRQSHNCLDARRRVGMSI